MSKILFIGHIHEGDTGWGRAIQGNIRALVAAGYDVVCRSIKLNKNVEPPNDIKALMSKSSEGCDIVFQHVLPPYIARGNFKKNIAYFVAETLDWSYSGFHHYLNLMDLVLVPNREMWQNCKSFIKCPTVVIPHASESEKFEKQYKPLELDLVGYNFYFIGEFNRRKRLSAIVQAYNVEFKKTEPANLILKVNKPGANPQQLSDEVQGLCNEIKKGLKLYQDIRNYPGELIIPSYLSEDEIMGLHEIGDCFVSSSFGEAWNWGAFDAMAYGNRVLHTDQGGPRDFLDTPSLYGLSHLVRGRLESAFGAYDTFDVYNSAAEVWKSCDVLELRKWMRIMYEKGKEKHKNTGLGFLNEYSYTNIGSKLKEVIGD